MVKFLNLPIRTQLLLLAVLLTMPALVVIIYAGMKQRATDYSHAVVESQKLADNLAAGVENLMHQAEQHASLLADLPDVQAHNSHRVNQILAKLKAKNPPYSMILVADASGKVWATSSAIEVPFSVAERWYFQKARATKRTSTGGFVFGLMTKKPTIHLAYPLIEQGRFAGVVVMGFDLDVLKSVLDRSQLSDGANYILTDNEGIIISRGRNTGQVVGKPIQQADLKRMENGPDKETYEFTRVDGDPRITTYRKVWLTGEEAPFIYVRAGISRKETLAEGNRSLALSLSALVFLVMIAFGAVLAIGKRSISDRVTLLKQASQRLADGEKDITVSSQVAGGELGSLGRTFDSMAQQLAVRENALRESERNYRDIFDAASDALFVHEEVSGIIIEANKTAEVMFGYRREEMLNMSLVALSSGEPPYSLPEALQWAQKAVEEGPQDFVWSCRRKNGTLFWAEVTCSSKTISGTKRILAVVRDITERQEVARMKDEMLSAVSHEMRTPLTAMLGFLQYVMENPIEEAQMKEYLAIMLREAERLNGTINNFLDMQRLKAMQRSYNLEHLDVGRLLKDAIEIFDGPSGNHTMIMDLEAGLPLISGDPVLLHQMLNNLISNAIKYSPEGSIITLGARYEQGGVIFWVKDNGVGIPMDSLDKVFELFFRVDNTSTRRTTGTGLGLALVKEIVAAHNGRVWVESEPGQGSTFYVAIDAVADSSAPEDLSAWCDNNRCKNAAAGE